MTLSIDDQKGFISEYEKKQKDYVAYADFLEEVLKKVVDQLRFLAIVQKRAKEVESFSTKIIKKNKYQNPLIEVTDLCGARIIVHFQSQVSKVCEKIKEIFLIDEPNSLDHKSRLKVNEFGYRSVHYIVTPRNDEILGTKVDKKFKEMKAEIQVRTLAEHLWADISHDRLYKTELIIPEEWKREAARLSAILENADITFSNMSKAIDSVSNIYELQYETEKVQKETIKLETLIGIQGKKPVEGIRNVLNLISMYNALNERAKAKSLIGRWIAIMSDIDYWQTRLKFEDNMLDLTECFESTYSTEYMVKIADAKANLRKLHDLYLMNNTPTAEELSFLYYRYSCILQNNDGMTDETLDNISTARELMPENPLYLTVLTECMVLLNLDLKKRIITEIRNDLEKDILSLKSLISLGIDAIPAWFTVGRCHFFLGNKKECIKAYANAVSVMLDKNFTSNCFLINAEIFRAKRLRSFNKDLADQIFLYLNLAMAISEIPKEKESYLNVLAKRRKRKDPLNRPVIIVAGGASKMDEEKIKTYSEYIRELMYEFEGTIISGGTKAGIPGLVGNVKKELSIDNPVKLELLAYLPHKLPQDAVKSEDYDNFYETGSDEFSVMDILTSWTDIILSDSILEDKSKPVEKIKPSDVLIVGIDGGEIAEMEFRIALSFGAKVCLVAYSGRAVSELIQEKHWKNTSTLIELPNDPFTLWAIVNQKKPTRLSVDDIGKLAPLVHEYYRQKRLEKFTTAETDINNYKVVMEWKYLDEALKNSNKQQVAFYEHILRRVNLKIRKNEHISELFNIKDNLDPAEYEKLAKLEHARWNAERLLDGWKYGPDKDLINKISPYIVPWDKLDENIKPYDFEPVENIPMMLQKIDYEVYK